MKKKRSLLKKILAQLNIDTIFSPELINAYERFMPSYTVKKEKGKFVYMGTGEYAKEVIAKEYLLGIVLKSCQNRIRTNIQQMFEEQLKKEEIFKL